MHFETYTLTYRRKYSLSQCNPNKGSGLHKRLVIIFEIDPTITENVQWGRVMNINIRFSLILTPSQELV
jgi:hypothetical protein